MREIEEKGVWVVKELWVNKPCCGGSREGPITRSRTYHRSAHHKADWQGEKRLEKEVQEVRNIPAVKNSCLSLVQRQGNGM